MLAVWSVSIVIVEDVGGVWLKSVPGVSAAQRASEMPATSAVRTAFSLGTLLSLPGEPTEVTSALLGMRPPCAVVVRPAWVFRLPWTVAAEPLGSLAASAAACAVAAAPATSKAVVAWNAAVPSAPPSSSNFPVAPENRATCPSVEEPGPITTPGFVIACLWSLRAAVAADPSAADPPIVSAPPLRFASVNWLLILFQDAPL